MYRGLGSASAMLIQYNSDALKRSADHTPPSPSIRLTVMTPPDGISDYRAVNRSFHLPVTFEFYILCGFKSPPEADERCSFTF